MRLFNTNPFAIAFKRSAAEGFVALGATNRLLRVTLDAQGVPTHQPAAAMPGDPGNIIRIELKDPAEIVQPDPDDTIGGKNPRGIVINSTDTRAYVMDFLSRDVAVVDISGDDPTQYKTLARIQSADLPGAGTEDAIVQRGKQLFNSAIGPEGTLANSHAAGGTHVGHRLGHLLQLPPAGADRHRDVDVRRRSAPGDLDGEHVRRSAQAVIENGAPKLPDSHQRALNWSAVRDEVQDFTRNIRAVSGGGGLISRHGNRPEGVAGLAQVPDLVPVANSGRSADLDAIATYLASGVRAPISPVGGHDVGAQVGRSALRGGGLPELPRRARTGRSASSTTLRRRPPPRSSTRSWSGSSAAWARSTRHSSPTA